MSFEALSRSAKVTPRARARDPIIDPGLRGESDAVTSQEHAAKIFTVVVGHQPHVPAPRFSLPPHDSRAKSLRCSYRSSRSRLVLETGACGYPQNHGRLAPARTANITVRPGRRSNVSEIEEKFEELDAIHVEMKQLSRLAACGAMKRTAPPHRKKIHDRRAFKECLCDAVQPWIRQ